MAQRMERTVPASMKKYVQPYMQQNVVSPSVGGAASGPSATPHFNPHPNTVSNFQPQNHFETAGNPLPQAPAPVAPPQPQVQAQPAQPVTAPEPYDFIMNAGEQPAASRLPLPRLDSMPKRALLAGVGLLAVLIIFIVVKGALSGSSNLPLFVGVAQDQQEMIHLTTNTSTGGQQLLGAASQNFAATTSASLTSSQSAILTYLAANGNKVKGKQLGLKVSQQLDTQLANATAAGTYDQVFQQIMKAQLTTYLNDLNQTYQKTTGKKGRALLNSSYIQAKLLLSQLSSSQ
jgi:hypothetical protein